MFLRFQLCSRRDFADITVVGSAGAFKVDKCPHAAFKIPGRNLEFTEILDEKSAVDWDFLCLLPSVVGIDARVAIVLHWKSGLLSHPLSNRLDLDFRMSRLFM